ncbi:MULTISPECIES: hypothetical protein [unclassified Mesorhizobium]|uniref:hypothetical protein n=1 Tax=unclassified Mesorhizobium TaxID=325217 RepID=UPI00112EE333|nr:MULTISPECIES: hypothetical protein [unclassified Mesorhizobium]TPJ51766.1 hypothetical protein FJ426_18855 [Mesorhizobium sp. B2-6-4]TPN42388.1 hypothetical protein FJ979_02270 [Mesorhizobium sp. B1-1-6]
MNQRHKAMLKILKLSDVTTARGFTENEVRTADAKIQQLMETHKLEFRKPRRRRWWASIWRLRWRSLTT